jgi:ethanolamine ammonia-lyase small subunit
VALLEHIAPRLRSTGWDLAPISIVRQGRVAVGDEIGTLLPARLAVMLIGERPGLSSPDSLGVYLTWDPVPGRGNAQRNCISNVRPPEGLPYVVAAHKLWHLMTEARRRQISGVDLKEDAPALPDAELMRLYAPRA